MGDSMVPLAFQRITIAVSCVGFLFVVLGCSSATTGTNGLNPKDADTKPGDKSTGTDTKPSVRPKDITTDKQSSDKPKDNPTDKPALSAQDLAKEFATDEEAAAKKYKDKTVTFEGVVAENRSLYGQLVLAGYKGDKNTVNLRCHLNQTDANTKDKKAKLKVGDKVKIQGIFSDSAVTSEEGKTALVLPLYQCVVLP